MNELPKCRYCGRQVAMPCFNTRDMEDAYIDWGAKPCLTALAALGGGERGIERVLALRAADVKAGLV